MIAFATSPGQVALDGDGSNSAYSAALAEAIPQPGLVLEEVFRRARRQVLAATGGRQTPWEHSSLTSEFYFRPRKMFELTAEMMTSWDLTKRRLREGVEFFRFLHAREA